MTTDLGGPGLGNSVALQSDGRIVVAGKQNTGGPNFAFVLARYNSNGTLDTSFGTGGIVTTDLGGSDQGSFVGLQGDGRICGGRGCQHRGHLRVRPGAL